MEVGKITREVTVQRNRRTIFIQRPTMECVQLYFRDVILIFPYFYIADTLNVCLLSYCDCCSIVNMLRILAQVIYVKGCVVILCEM